MHEKPKLGCTRDYDLFEMHEVNRELREKPKLLASMKAHGFMPSNALHCVRAERGKLKIVKGHHRFHYAKRLGLVVWYIVDNTNADIYDLEGDSGSRWSLRDFLTSRANAGNEHYQKVLDFQNRHALTQGTAISLMGGESAGGSNKGENVKDGSFKVASDLKHAHAVVDITDYFREKGVLFATQAAFVAAVSAALRVPECEPRLFKSRVLTAPPIQRRSTVNSYLDELEALYNYSAKGKRLALKFRAKEVGRARQASFGRSAR